MSEQWKDIPGYEGRYQVSDQGRVRSLDRYVEYSDGRRRAHPGKILAATHTTKGYAYVDLGAGRGTRRYVHVLVASAFFAKPVGVVEVNHKDGVKANNQLSNLEYVSHRENLEHAVRTGLNRQAKRIQALQACRVVAEYPSISSAAKAVGAHLAAIQYAIRNGTICRNFRWVLI